MRRVVVAGALLLAAAGQSLAADLPQPVPPQPAAPAYIPTPLYDWGGVYVGGNGGWTSVRQGGTSNISALVGPLPDGPTTHSSGFAAGGQVGFNFQATQWVFGLEGDADYLSNKSTVNAVDILGGSVTHVFKLDVLSTIRLRAGYTFDRVLLYSTGGFAMGEYQVTRNQLTAGLAPAGTIDTDNTLRLGWTVGAGLEYGITEHLTARAEYLFVGLQPTTYLLLVSGIQQRAPGANINMVRGGLNIKLGPF